MGSGPPSFSDRWYCWELGVGRFLDERHGSGRSSIVSGGDNTTRITPPNMVPKAVQTAKSSMSAYLTVAGKGQWHHSEASPATINSSTMVCGTKTNDAGFDAFTVRWTITLSAQGV